MIQGIYATLVLIFGIIKIFLPYALITIIVFIIVYKVNREVFKKMKNKEYYETQDCGYYLTCMYSNKRCNKECTKYNGDRKQYEPKEFKPGGNKRK